VRAISTRLPVSTPGMDEIIDGAVCGNDQVEAFSG
jgi:hypothetical protein